MRKLKHSEIELIKNLLASNAFALEEFILEAENYWVQEMKDGGMGSLRFVAEDDKERSLGETIAESEFIDEDEVPVMVSLSLDNNGDFFELDLWKVDFSPVRSLSS